MAAIFGRFSQNSESLLIEAQNLAHQLKRPLRSDVLLLAMLSQTSSLASNLLKSMGGHGESFREYLLANPEPINEPQQGGHTREMHQLLEESIRLASRFHFSLVEVEHLLFVIAKEEKFSGNTLLIACGLEPKAITTRLTEWLFSVAMINQQQGSGDQEGRGEREKVDIERFVFNVTEAAANGQLDAVIGRETEIDQLIHILLRRRKNNPLLVGEPGVGKTALVDALAQRIVRKAVPQALANKRILTLDLGLVVAGTMYRGQFEERLKGIVQEVQAQGNCILFIDEIHTLSGTGSAEGGFDAANILKPVLARGEITVIGATTHEEYRKHILKDKALDRRFQTLSIEEPSHKETVAMLKGIKGELEKHHHVMITTEAITTAVELSERYIHDRFLPDKAIDLLDQAATLHAEPYREDSDRSGLQQEIALVSVQKSEAALQGEFETAKELMDKENQLLKQLQKLEATEKKLKVAKPITAAHVSMVVSRRTGIPREEIERTLEPVSLQRVKTVLSKHVLGQEKAIATISQALMRNQLGLQQKGKPMASFLLVGPTGVGKTETARILAREVFNDDKALIKIDMSEYMERHSVSNLIGAPAGYVGFDQGGSLTEQVRKRPYSVVLFDEVEKAHPDVFNLLLQILEDGYATDNTGAHTSFEHTFIIMTSNIGMESFNQAARIGFSMDEDSPDAERRQKEELEHHITKEIQDFFRPELLGRLSGVIFYNPLDKAVVKKLVESKVKELKSKLKATDVSLTLHKSVIPWIVEQYDPEAGARSIDKLFLHHVEPPLIEALIAQGKGIATMEIKDDKPVVTVEAVK